MEKEPEEMQCGLKPFLTGEDDVFKNWCKFHDKMYILSDQFPEFLDRKTIDKKFLELMLRTAKDSKLLKIKAYTYYGLARVFGALVWGK